jgi:uncharacterized protein (TIGR02646 family)
VAEVIPVAPQPEPAAFDAQVRQRGLQWMNAQGIGLNQPLPSGTALPPYWRDCLADLHTSYGGICAYVAVFVERVTGTPSADHFVAKSQDPGLTYEWSNYRLACSKMNSRKRDFSDVLDPFTLAPGTFRMEPVTGRIYADPALPPTDMVAAEATIQRLHLDDAECRELRARHLEECLQGDRSGNNLRKYSPFVWQEAKRQGLL